MQPTILTTFCGKTVKPLFLKLLKLKIMPLMPEIVNSDNPKCKIQKTSSYLKKPAPKITSTLSSKIYERCLVCKQYSSSILLYNGHPNNSVEEYVALTHEKLSLYTGNEELDHKEEFPIHKVKIKCF